MPGRPLTWRLACGILVFVWGCALILSSLVQEFASASAAMRAALVGGGTAAAATALGTLPVLMSQSFSQRSYDSFLGFGAGVMLGATAFSLIVPALAAARAGGAGPFLASAMIGAGIGLGALLVYGLGRLVHVGQAMPRGRVWLFVAAVTLHNLPEGLAIGVAYAGPDIDRAHSLATGISIQDVPEGLVVALALRSVGHGRGVAATMGAFSGLIEPVAAAAGVALISMSAGLLPVGLAAAAGAMLFVIANDVIPESHRNGNGGFASAALTAGFILMTVLDTALS
jgi:ZIP family zinc transporter